MSDSQTGGWKERVRGAVNRGGNRLIIGYAYDAYDLSARLVVELRVDGLPLALARAEHLSDELRRSGIGDARYAFAFAVPPEVWKAGGRAQVFVANSDHLLAPPVEIGGDDDRGGANGGTGGVSWRGGLDLAGWIRAADGAAPRIRLSIDGRIVAEISADRWRHRPVTGGAMPVRRFIARLPEAFADGRTRRVSVTTAEGEPLAGSPVDILAFPEPLEACVAKAYGPDLGALGARARLFDRLSPRVTPLDAWERWLRDNPPPATTTGATLMVALIGDDPAEVQRSLDSLRVDPTLDWVAAALPSPDRIGFAAADLAAFVRSEGGRRPTLLVAPAGAVFQSGAPARLATALSASPEACLAYGDIILGLADPALPLAFPAFDYERWLEQGYGALVFALPSALAPGAGDLYGLACAAFRGRRPGAVLHLPGFAARLQPPDRVAASSYLAAATRTHLAERGIVARIEAGPGHVLPAIRVMRPRATGPVSVIVDAREGPAHLETCLASIRADLTATASELIVVVDGSTDPHGQALLAVARRAGARVWLEPDPSNFARRCNRAAAAARGEFLVFLDGAVEAGSPGFLHELLSRAAEPAVAAVGPVLRWPSGVVRHAGLVLGPGFSVRSPFTDRLGGDPGYGDLMRIASEPSALDGECLLVRRSVYATIGGMDERHFPLFFGAADLCLRLGARGGAIVLTPHLDLKCASRMPWQQRGDPWRRCREREVRLLRARWGEVLGADPAYNPLLALAAEPYAGLADPPHVSRTRRRLLPEPRALAPGL